MKTRQYRRVGATRGPYLLRHLLTPLIPSAVLLLGIPASAWALPTPESLVVSFQLIPTLIAVVGGMLLAASAKYRSWINRSRDPIMLLSVTAAALFLLLLLTALMLLKTSQDLAETERVGNIAMYFRSDASLDARELQGRDEERRWFEEGIIKVLPYEDLGLITDGAEKPILINFPRLKLSHDSGFPALLYHGSPLEPRFLYPAELETFLRALLADDPENAARPIVFFDWYEYALWRPYSQSESVIELLQRFNQVYALPWLSLQGLDYHAQRSPHFFVGVRDPVTGAIREARFLTDRLDYPVRKEDLAYEEPRVIFPNAMSLLPTERVVELIDDDQVQIVAPFSSLYRPLEVQQYYFSHFLKDIDQDRIHYLDFNAPDISAQKVALAKQLRGQPFIVLGLTKQDWIYMGVDLAYELWDQYGREHPETFQYLGGSMRAPLVAAHLINRGYFMNKVGRKLAQVYLAAIDSSPLLASIPFAILILLAGIGVRLLFLPLGYLEARSRTLHTDLKGWIQRQVDADPSFFFLHRYEDGLARDLGRRKRYEVLGALLSLVLILPAYSVLTAMQPYLGEVDRHFLWVPDIAEPSWLLALVLNAIILLKVLAGRMSPFPKRWGRGDLLLLLLFVPFQWLLSQIPASVILVALGVLGTQVIVEWTVRLRTWRRVPDQLSLSQLNEPITPDQNPWTLPLEATGQLQQIGNKARRLGALSQYSGGLFKVPEGLVIRPASLAQLLSEPTGGQRAQANEALLQDLPGSDPEARWAVRSCGVAEDAAKSSLAGQFDTLLNVPREQLMEAALRVAKSFGDQGQGKDSVLVQRMVSASMAGVLFTRSPTNRALSLIEYTSGLADALVSGETTPTRTLVGYTSGSVFPTSEHSDGDRLSDALARRLFLIGRLVEQWFGTPQDIEWAYDASEDVIYLVQSRDVTAFVVDAAIDAEQQRLISEALLTSKPRQRRTPLWIRGDLDEVVKKPSPLTLSLLREVYGVQGSLGIALRRWRFRLPRRGKSLITGIFGEAYQAARSPGDGFSPANMLAAWRMRRALQGEHWHRHTAALAERIEALETQLEAPVMDDEPTDRRALVARLDQRLRFFVTEVYSLAFEVTLLAKHAPAPDPDANGHGQRPSSRTARLYRDLQAYQQARLSKALFLSRWGHRGPSEYDLAVPSYAERPDQLPPVLDRVAPEPQPPTVADSERPRAWRHPAEHLIFLKEEAKDVSLRYLRRINPLLQGIAAASGVPQDALYDLELAEIRTLANADAAGTQALLVNAEARQQQRAHWDGIDLGEAIHLESLEQLAPYAGDRGTPRAAPSRDDGLVGRMVSVRKPFQGRLRPVRPEDSAPQDCEQGDILLATNLSPDLVPFFTGAAGCIAARGGELSHAAIVAREQGLPIVVGIDVTDPRLQEGLRYQVSASGEISRL